MKSGPNSKLIQIYLKGIKNIEKALEQVTPDVLYFDEEQANLILNLQPATGL